MAISRKNKKQDDSDLTLYQHIITSTLIGSMRILHFENFSLKSMLIQRKGAKMLEDIKNDRELENFVTFLNEKDPIILKFFEEKDIVIDHFHYISRIMKAVYLHTILDTFLNETLKFLLLRNPGVLDSTCHLGLNQVLREKNKYVVINNVIDEKTRNEGYKSFKDRIKYLNKTFGLGINFSNKVYESLEECIEHRNLLVHDSSFYNIGFDDKGKIALKQTGCIKKPKKVGWEEIEKTQKLYQVVIHTVYSRVRKVIFKDIPIGNADEAFLEKMLDLSAEKQGNGDTPTISLIPKECEVSLRNSKEDEVVN